MARVVDPKNLVGAHEIAERLGLAFPNSVHSWRRRYAEFPEPLANLQMGLVWDWSEVKAWWDLRRRKIN